MCVCVDIDIYRYIDIDIGEQIMPLGPHGRRETVEFLMGMKKRPVKLNLHPAYLLPHSGNHLSKDLFCA